MGKRMGVVTVEALLLFFLETGGGVSGLFQDSKGFADGGGLTTGAFYLSPKDLVVCGFALAGGT